MGELGFVWPAPAGARHATVTLGKTSLATKLRRTGERIAITLVSNVVDCDGADVEMEIPVPEAIRTELARRGHVITVMPAYSTAMGFGSAVVRHALLCVSVPPGSDPCSRSFAPFAVHFPTFPIFLFKSLRCLRVLL